MMKNSKLINLISLFLLGPLLLFSQADFTLLNPQALAEYDGEASIEYIYREIFDCHQLVNRSDGVVQGVYVGGQRVWQQDRFTPIHGRHPLGHALRVGAR